VGLLAERVQLSTGESLTLRELVSASPHVLVFVRHLGCTFCREHVRELATLPPSSVTFVCTADMATTNRFRVWIGTPHRFICDESAALFQRFGLKRANLAQAISPKIAARGLISVLKGNINGKPAGDPMRLGGAFLISGEGLILWSHVAKDVSDNASFGEIKAALDAAS